GVRRRLDARRRGSVLGATPLVLPALGDQLLLAPCELDLVVELVLGDRALVLDGQRAPPERRPVGLLLDQLAGRRAECALELRLGADRADAHRDDLYADVREPLVGAQAVLDPLAPQPRGVDQPVG